MRLAGPSWVFFIVASVFIAMGAVCVLHPALACRMRQVGDEANRGRTPTRSALVVLRVIGSVFGLVGLFLLVAVLIR